MNKKVFIATLMLGISMAGFSQTEANAIAKNRVQEKNKEFLDGIKGKGKIKKREIIKEPQQFFFQNDKSMGLREAYKKLEEGKEYNFYYGKIRIGDAVFMTKEDKKGKGVKVDSSKAVVPVYFQTHTVTKNGVAKYNVTLKWEVKMKKRNKASLKSSEASPISYLDSEKNTMQSTVKSEIIKWYAHLSERLDSKYVGQSVSPIESKKVTTNDIEIKNEGNLKFSSIKSPDIRIDIDPNQFIDEGQKHLYTDPKASLVISPKFEVTVDKSLRTGNVYVTYSEDIIKPVTDYVKVERRKKADAIVNELAQQLSTYVSSRDVDQRKYINNMFDMAGSNVQVSHMPKRGTEKIKARKVQKYLSSLRGSTLDMHIIDFETEDWNTLVYTVCQKYQSKTYADKTQKKIYLNYVPEKDTYLINKIEVVPNSTIRE